MEDLSWPSDWLRATLPLLVLRTLVDEPRYGYAITSVLADVGVGTIKGGTLYPLLARLEKDGLVTSLWRQGESGPARKYFSLTEAGRRHLGELERQWSDFTALTTRTP